MNRKTSKIKSGGCGKLVPTTHTHTLTGRPQKSELCATCPHNTHTHTASANWCRRTKENYTICMFSCFDARFLTHSLDAHCSPLLFCLLKAQSARVISSIHTGPAFSTTNEIKMEKKWNNCKCSLHFRLAQWVDCLHSFYYVSFLFGLFRGVCVRARSLQTNRRFRFRCFSSSVVRSSNTFPILSIEAYWMIHSIRQLANH